MDLGDLKIPWLCQFDKGLPAILQDQRLRQCGRDSMLPDGEVQIAAG
jgi:hypothetical protein